MQRIPGYYGWWWFDQFPLRHPNSMTKHCAQQRKNIAINVENTSYIAFKRRTSSIPRHWLGVYCGAQRTDGGDLNVVVTLWNKLVPFHRHHTNLDRITSMSLFISWSPLVTIYMQMWLTTDFVGVTQGACKLCWPKILSHYASGMCLKHHSLLRPYVCTIYHLLINRWRWVVFGGKSLVGF